MIFGIVTHAVHKLKGGKIYAYEPYVREMNLWAKSIEKIIILCPISDGSISKIETHYLHENIEIIDITNFNIISIKNILNTILVVPTILKKIFLVAKKSDHIHLRCPGNIGLLGCFVQIFFPFKKKTVKYAGNWDPKSKQPFTYKLQKWILSNSLLTRNCKVLVYGKWENQSKNILPFFTASYFEKEIIKIPKKNFLSTIRFIFVGTFSQGKRPMMSVKVVEILKNKNYNVRLDMYGNGVEFTVIKEYIKSKNLNSIIFLHDNQPKEIVKQAFQKAHFLIFNSQSEGWPKVVAEAMFWRCLPISSNVSCISYMLDNGNRGEIVDVNIDEIELSDLIVANLENESSYQQKVLKAQNWSQKFTLDKFEKEIQKLLKE
ncbi:glycosyltransferase [uncultured Polaribacter sp.]|uniref:glycosyltransferase n=1 Tax=uncultured Polaribacter sp. TaxID=174711 RepID=UPI00261DF7FD|nr:glycosyltransferase [uncultured Polaribacter sp.]